MREATELCRTEDHVWGQGKLGLNCLSQVWAFFLSHFFHTSSVYLALSFLYQQLLTPSLLFSNIALALI